MIYVGAVAVLFLFVLMMLNIKFTELINNNNIVAIIALVLAFFMIKQLFFLLSFNFENLNDNSGQSLIYLLDFSNIATVKADFIGLYKSFSNTKMLGLVFFSKFLFQFIIAGFVLLLAMLAAIVLTIHKKFVNKNQNVYNQILKQSTFKILT